MFARVRIALISWKGEIIRDACSCLKGFRRRRRTLTIQKPTQHKQKARKHTDQKFNYEFDSRVIGA